MSINKSSIVFIFSVFLLSGCTSDTSFQSRLDTAQNLAIKSSMIREDIHAGNFVLASWNKINPNITNDHSIHIYIEGDGLSRLGPFTPSDDPTPINPVAFKLAALDTAPYVIYLARPCQYTMQNHSNLCDSTYWTNKRYSYEVIESFNAALDNIKTHYHATGFHLIGFSGGANIAGLLAEQRQDILSLRTVAGNIDTDYFNKLHNVIPIPESLNMATKANLLANLPQRHFIGGKDINVPYSVFESYKQAQGPTSCTQVTYNAEADHTTGWIENWPEFLKLPVACIPALSSHP